ncbi:MAG: hypothetical protein M3N13_02720, partial [Candidatus Eremiobacteraeota bacterium]|nr:hypothetical protein [Candidatus Eremiobacteraeota bacterium]
MNKRLWPMLCIIAGALVSATASAATTGETTYRLSAAGPVSAAADTTGNPVELIAKGFVDTVTRRPSTAETTVRLSVDIANLYVAFDCEQAIPVTANQRIDGVGHGQDDTVTISLDTSAAGLRTYAFSATPRGTRYAVSSESTRYQPQWRVVSEARQAGYRVRMTIPLSVLRITPGPQIWRVNLTRRIALT